MPQIRDEERSGQHTGARYETSRLAAIDSRQSPTESLSFATNGQTECEAKGSRGCPASRNRLRRLVGTRKQGSHPATFLPPTCFIWRSHDTFPTTNLPNAVLWEVQSTLLPAISSTSNRTTTTRTPTTPRNRTSTPPLRDSEPKDGTAKTHRVVDGARDHTFSLAHRQVATGRPAPDRQCLHNNHLHNPSQKGVTGVTALRIHRKHTNIHPRRAPSLREQTILATPRQEAWRG